MLQGEGLRRLCGALRRGSCGEPSPVVLGAPASAVTRQRMQAALEEDAL